MILSQHVIDSYLIKVIFREKSLWANKLAYFWEYEAVIIMQKRFTFVERAERDT